MAAKRGSVISPKVIWPKYHFAENAYLFAENLFGEMVIAFNIMTSYHHNVILDVHFAESVMSISPNNFRRKFGGMVFGDFSAKWFSAK